MKKDKKCINCGEITPFWGKAQKKYCNTKCLREYEKKSSVQSFTHKNCLLCGTVFLPITKVNKFCSRACKYKHGLSVNRKNLVLKKCGFCEAEFKPYTSLDKFCSAKCRIEKMKSKRSKRWSKASVEKRMGKNNPAYVHGMNTIGSKVDSTGLRLFRKNRDEYKNKMISDVGYLYCERCKRSNVRFETHHIVYRSEKPKHEYLHNPINLIVVCVSCHNWYHSKKGNRNELVISRKLNEYFGNDILNK